MYLLLVPMGTAVAQWLRCCATNRKVAGSIQAGVVGIFHCHKILPLALCDTDHDAAPQNHSLHTQAEHRMQ